MYGVKNNSSKNNQDVLHTSLDVDPQIACQDKLLKALQKNRAEGTSLILAKVQTGEIFFQVSIPNFMNKKSSGLYELGSVLKPLIMA